MSQRRTRSVIDDRTINFEPSVPVSTAIDEVKSSTVNSHRTVYYSFVLGEGDELQGVVSMRELLNAPKDAELSSVMVEDVVSVGVNDSIGEIAETFTAHQFPVLPAVDDSGSFEGVVRAEDIIQELDEETDEEVRELIQDVEYDPGEEREFECFECGTLIVTDSPAVCPECGGDLRSRSTTIE